MKIDEQIKALHNALGTFEDIKRTQEQSFVGAVETTEAMEDSEEKDWLMSSLKNAKGGTLTAEEFKKQMKFRGYGG